MFTTAQISRSVLTFLAAVTLASIASSQGEFVNFETPQVKPITVATLGAGAGTRDFLLVCNTPDNSVEIYEADPPFGFLQRVPVGLGPVTVRWSKELGRFFTANFDGDSVTSVRLQAVVDSFGVTRPHAIIDATNLVGDEPADVVVFPSTKVIVTSLNSQSAVSLQSADDVGMLLPRFNLVYEDDVSGFKFAAKQPRVMESLRDGRVYVLNFMGDQLAPGQFYDLDLFIHDPTTGDADTYSILGGLGTTNHSFAVNAAGTKMLVVGTRAQNFSAVGVKAVAGLKTGFVQSHMWVVDIPAGQAPQVHPEAPVPPVPLPVIPRLFSINLNRDYTQSGLGELPPDMSLSQPTDVVILENNNTAYSDLDKVFITAFHSDKVAVLTPDVASPGGWIINRIPIPPTTPANSYSAAGPRGLALSKRAVSPASPGQPGLVYCLNRLSNSVSVIDPHQETVVGTFSLQNDPTPPEIRQGRKFLYSADFSGNKAVSCASCHVDGRTDGLVWNLGDLNIGPAIAPWFHDGNGQTVNSMPNFPNDKGALATQTLQGLVNSRVNSGMQALFTNAPYHWRGDKAGFSDFNEAFVNLQGAPNIGTPSDPRGVTAQEMAEFTSFINTIVHPPNPEQWYDRTTTGSLGTDPNNPLQGSGALLGMKLFHVLPIVGQRSCVQCHSLPEGSSNTSTIVDTIAGTLGGVAQIHPIESAAMRNIFQREMLLHTDTKMPGFDVPFTGNAGLLHAGNPAVLSSSSMNSFVGNTFFASMPGPTDADRLAQVEALIAFTRQFDTGLARLVGAAYTYVPGDSNNDAARKILEQQAEEANIGLAVYTRHTGVERGYFYDLSVSPPVYRDANSGNVVTGPTLGNRLSQFGGTVVLQATPVGSERRIASLTGQSISTGNPAATPVNITLEPMAPSTPYVDVARFTANVDPTPPAISLQSLRTLQDAVVGPDFGVQTLRHEPPRRFRISGQNIRQGATLLLGMASGGTPMSSPVQSIEMPLYPTAHRTQSGEIIWETTVEADPRITLALLNGGLWAPGVAETLQGQLPPSQPLDPYAWNQFLVLVVNEDGSFNTPGWQTLRVQDGR